jgi:hypothetical protein
MQFDLTLCSQTSYNVHTKLQLEIDIYVKKIGIHNGENPERTDIALLHAYVLYYSTTSIIRLRK